VNELKVNELKVKFFPPTMPHFSSLKNDGLGKAIMEIKIK
jgi:hypothetical protein